MSSRDARAALSCAHTQGLLHTSAGLLDTSAGLLDTSAGLKLSVGGTSPNYPDLIVRSVPVYPRGLHLTTVQLNVSTFCGH